MFFFASNDFLFTFLSGDCVLSHSRWPATYSFEKVEKLYGYLPFRITDYEVYMNYLVFFMQDSHPKKKGKI